MTAPHRWPRAAHSIAPNGALFSDTSYCRLGCKEGSRPLPTNNREIGSYRQSTYFRQVCRGRIYASRAVLRYIAIFAWLQRAAFMPPLQSTRKIVIVAKSRAGHAPPLPRNDLYCPVGRGDPTPPEKPSPLGRRWRACAPDEGKTSGRLPLISHLR